MRDRASVSGAGKGRKARQAPPADRRSAPRVRRPEDVGSGRPRNDEQITDPYVIRWRGAERMFFKTRAPPE